MKRLVTSAVIAVTALCQASSLDETAREKITTLERLISQADKKGIDTQKEKMTVRTAQVFLKYARWDAANVAENTGYFQQAALYKKNAAEMAETLPDFERTDVITMLDAATDYLTSLNKGEFSRKPTPQIDWAKVEHEGDQLTYEGRPVFLADYTWKPRVPELDEFHGQQDGFFLMHAYVTDEKGAINRRITQELDSKPEGKMGFVFLNHKGAPKWAKEKYGPGFAMREDTYTGYDIDHPGAREINHLLIAGTVPKMAGKKYTELGYMLCNEPHFFTTEGVWATGPASEYTIAKFKTWLREKHGSIGDLNTLWNTCFASFDDVKITIPISQELQGSPIWYDWVSFNMFRVTDWYQFLKDEICRYDPAAKVHLKVMPNLWSDNKRNHGLDFEALTRMSGIVGNDAGASYNHMWGPKQEWEDRYAFDWREMCMSYDFFKSVCPQKIIYNTEAHYLSTNHSRDLKQDPMYARGTSWLATTQGLNVSQIWFWARNEDGSVRNGAGKGYAGSNNHQPRIVNEIASTLMDLNAYAEEITAMQRQRKPLRIFYSKTSAINKEHHMDDVFRLYESLIFDGVPIGFATKDIIREQDHCAWDAILVQATEFVTCEELNALQLYLDQGGTVFLDSVSLKKDEYGRPLDALTASKGTLVNVESYGEMKAKAMALLERQGLLPNIRVSETNGIGEKGCIWKCTKNRKGNQVLSIVNLGKTNATLSIQLNGTEKASACTDILKGIPVNANPTLKPYQVLFVEVREES